MLVKWKLHSLLDKNFRRRTKANKTFTAPTSIFGREGAFFLLHHPPEEPNYHARNVNEMLGSR